MGFSLYYKCFVVVGFTLAHNDWRYVLAGIRSRNFQKQINDE